MAINLNGEEGVWGSGNLADNGGRTEKISTTEAAMTGRYVSI